MAHTSCLRLMYKELTVRVIIFTTGSMHEQFHCSERLFQQLFIGKEARVFHVTSPQMIMKLDADVHEEMCTYVVLLGDTTMFQDIDEHMPTTSAPETMQIKVVCSRKVCLAQKPEYSTTATLMFTSKSALTTRPCSKTSMSACRHHRLLYRCRSRSFAHRRKTTRCR